MFDNSELKKDILEAGQGFVAPQQPDNKEGEKMKAGVAQVNNKLDDSEVHIMPAKFLPAAPQKQVGGKQRIVVIAMILIFVLVAVIGGGIWYLMNQNSTPPTTSVPVVNNSKNTNTNTNTNVNDNSNTNTNTNTNTNVNDNSNTNTNTNTNTNVNDNSNTNTNTNTNTNVNDNSNTNTNTNTNTNVNDNSNTNDNNQLVDSSDIDNDLLTTAEELLYLTNPQKDDSDKDGFQDGQEIINLYNPLVPRGLLLDSGLVTIYNDANYNFKIFRPKSWNASIDEEIYYTVLFLPNSESGDVIKIEIIPNEEGLTLAQLQSQVYSDNVYQNYSLVENPAIRSLDGNQIISLIGNNFFVITYDPSNFGEASYNTTFEMMINSFELVKGLPSINE